jgi:hypothetical protein
MRRIVYSLFFFDGDRQSGSYVIERNRDKLSTRKFDVGVFTQAGPEADTAPAEVSHRLFTNHHKSPETTSPNLGSRIFTHALRRTGGEIAVLATDRDLRARSCRKRICRMGIRAIEWGVK